MRGLFTRGVAVKAFKLTMISSNPLYVGYLPDKTSYKTKTTALFNGGFSISPV
jgi:hypothetical protein